MSLIVDRARQIAEAVEAAGVRVAFDPRSMNPPCVLIVPPDQYWGGLGAGVRVEWKILVLAPPPGNLDAWAEIDRMLDIVRGVTVLERAVPRTTFTTGDGTPIPAYECRVTEYLHEVVEG